MTFLGPSGCGKTTTLRMIAGFETPTAGSIRIDGRDVTHLRANRRAIGMVFQAYALFPNMTVEGNIGFGLKVAGRPATAIKARVDEMLALIKLPDLADRYPHQLSGGQQQRVSLARALAPSPQILLLDEPLSALDARIRVALREEIRALQRKLGITTIFVTHDQEEALSISDRIVVMNEGAIEQVGSPAEIYNRPRTRFVASFVGTLNMLEGVVVDPAAGAIRVGGATIFARGPIDGATAGDTRTLALRPEALRPGRPADGDNARARRDRGRRVPRRGRATEGPARRQGFAHRHLQRRRSGPAPARRNARGRFPPGRRDRARRRVSTRGQAARERERMGIRARLI